MDQSEEKEKKLFKTKAKVMPELNEKKYSMKWTKLTFGIFKVFARIINPSLYIIFCLGYFIHYVYFFN